MWRFRADRGQEYDEFTERCSGLLDEIGKEEGGQGPRNRRSGYFSLYVIVWRGFVRLGDASLPIGAVRYDRFCRKWKLRHSRRRADFAYSVTILLSGFARIVGP
jgi:hypothetical protein